MARVVLDHISKHFGSVAAVKDFHLTVEDKEFVILVGPSGCGKSTALRMLAGLEDPDAGAILIGERDVTDLPPKDRDIAMVFQEYALYPHMSVYKNMAFGLKLRSFPKDEIDRRVREAADILGIQELLDRKPKQLSGGQRQRVAVGRAIVRKPAVFLFDEPLSNLDAKLRVQMRAELSKLHDRLQTTIIYVTHDQVEAMSLSDRIAVMNFAVLQQYGSPHDVYNRPKNLFVANFIGSPTINFMEGSFGSGAFTLKDFIRGKIPLSQQAKHAAGQKLTSQEVVIGVRPEHLKIVDRRSEGAGFRGEDDGGSPSGIAAKVVSSEPLGSKTIVYLHPDANPGVILKSSMGSDYRPAIGEMKELTFMEKDLYVFDKKTTELAARF
jgi:multiple sugar transport system ATP-binding protein